MRKKNEIWMKRASRAGCRDERKTVQRKVLDEAWVFQLKHKKIWTLMLALDSLV
jgi:hypothetical protein